MGALRKLERLRGVSYDLKDSGKHEIGLIAEEVGAVVPEVVSWAKNGRDASGVDYGQPTAPLIDATKEQQKLIEKEQEQISTQQTQIGRLSSKVFTPLLITAPSNNDVGLHGVRTISWEDFLMSGPPAQ